MAHAILSILPHCVGVEASLYLERVVIGSWQFKTIGETLPEKVQGSLLKPITGYWPAMTQQWIRETWIMTWKFSERQSKKNYTGWPRSTTSWRCGRAATTYMLNRRNLVLQTSK
jgi:hypothetical protein